MTAPAATEERVLDASAPAQERPLARELGAHVLALDGLRGVAILLVMSFHYVTASDFGSDAALTRKIIGAAVFGWTGVDLFFVLSGFLITGILRRARSAPGYFKNFYVRRALRIFPLYYIALVVIFLIVPHFVQHLTPGVQRIYATQGWIWAYAQDLGILANNEDFYDVDWLWIGHFWSLAVEEHFYLIWPLLVYFCSRRALVRIAVVLLFGTPILRFALLGLQVDPAAIYTFTFSRVDELALGGLLAIASERASFETLARYARYALLGSGLYLLAVVVLRRGPLWWGHWTALGLGFSALALFAAGTLVLALNPAGGWLRSSMELRGLRWFGKFSYGAYVIHTPMQPVFLRWFPPRSLAYAARGLGHSGSRLVGLLGFATLGIGLTMLLAVTSFYVLETPFLRLKRYFEY